LSGTVSETPPAAGSTARFRVWLDILVKIGAVFAGIFAVHEYLEARRDGRTARTLTYVERFQSEDTAIGASIRRIDAELWANERQLRWLKQLADVDPPAAEEALDKFVTKLVDGTDQEPGLRQAVHDVTTFFDELAICARARLCDEATAEAFFAGRAVELWNVFEPEVAARRSLAPAYGEAWESFAHAD